MLEVLSLKQADKWDELVKSFSDYDVYYLSGYTKAFYLHKDGQPLAFYYEDEGVKAINVVMKRDIANDPNFKELEKNKYFDLATPYGYGGWLIEGNGVCCFLAGDGEVLGHTYVDEQDLIGMDKDAVVTTVTDIYNNEYANIALNVSMNDSNYEIPVFDAMISPVDGVVEEAMDFGHGFFLTRGVAFIESMLTERYLKIIPSDVDVDKIAEAIEASNIVEDNKGFSSNWQLTDNELILTKRSVIREVDSEKLKIAMANALLKGDYDTVIESPYTEIRVISPDLSEIYKQVHVEPQNATIQPENDYAIIESVDGVGFDLEKAQSLFANAAEGDTVSVPIERIPAEVTAKQLEESLFRDVMGTYTTTVKGSADRRSNVRLAASKCEKIMVPGEVFSYNETVGKRTEAAGFKKAPAYNNGDTVQELGGGICQASSTLYNAVVIANLEITERHNHSFASSYVPLGQDATVSWGGPDFKFTNNTDYPIKIEQVYENDKLTFNIIGTNVTGEYCALTNETLSTNPYGVVEQPSDELYIGQSKRSVEGETGYKVKTYRHLYSADGTEISVTEEDTSNYIRRDEVRLVGTKLPDDMMAALVAQMLAQQQQQEQQQ